MELRAGISLAAIEQWGFTNNTGRPYITFPFKFSNVFTAISCICHNGSPSEANTVYNVSISGMNIGASGGGSGKYWCAFGVAQQQWGASGYAVTFPIAFNVVYNVLSIPQTTASTSNAYWGRFYITALTKNGFNVSDTGAGSNRWIAIGSAQPQWGKILGDTVNLKIINFPVSFNECFGGLALFNGDPVAAAEYATITDITNTNFKIYMYANNAGTGYANANIFYLFLGAQQQWRNNPGLWAIPFTEFVAGGITMTRTGSQSSGTWYGDSGTISLTGYTASCATNESWVSNISGSAIAVGL